MLDGEEGFTGMIEAGPEDLHAWGGVLVGTRGGSMCRICRCGSRSRSRRVPGLIKWTVSADYAQVAESGEATENSEPKNLTLDGVEYVRPGSSDQWPPAALEGFEEEKPAHLEQTRERAEQRRRQLADDDS